MNVERPQLADDDLQRYFDNDLSPEESDRVRQALEASDDNRQQLLKLQRLNRLFGAAAEDFRAQLDVDADQLFDSVRDGIASDPPSRLHVIRGERIRRGVVAGGVGFALAAAILLAFMFRSPEPTARPAEEKKPREMYADRVTLIEGPQGTEVEEVDFGSSTGTVFAVEGASGQSLAVVWIND